MKIIADTNVLLRAALQDDPSQSPKAKRLLEESEQVAVSRHALCEFIWVLSRSYKLPQAEIATAISKLLNSRNVIADDVAIEAGLRAMEAGSDFADGVIAREGAWLGGETFVSFDKKAVEALAAQGLRTQLLK
ncbi:MAG TPA: type II toxin-antitoxin system VapC family toxin [Terracidiphilus sp.]|jgi:predicted nucleic-acid-binding protein|nr:type II toxin-antitoxin system VapC family toxin [Terracidiphilus sp.]